MAILYIDKKKYIVDKNKNLLHTCLSLGYNIPYFCWHPILGSFGACRQCAVKQFQNSNDNIGKIVMSCITNIVEKNYISLQDVEVKKFQKSILELLLTNHPHDCPVCEEGGNCHLQDITILVAHNIRRYNFPKRTYNNQYLGSFISHNMNRCITCYRCVRYYRDYLDGSDFNVYGIHNNIYFGRLMNGKLKSKFSGNLIEICPTGVFTDKINSFNFVRKWDMYSSPSICQQCCIGCNIIVSERNGILRKIENRYNKKINCYFLCDLGRFGYSYINSNFRIKYPFSQKNNFKKKLNKNQALSKALSLLKKSTKILGIGSFRASIESNFALRKLVGLKNFYISSDYIEWNMLKIVMKILSDNRVLIPSLSEIENYDTILIIGEDISKTAPMISLSVRQAVKKRMVYEASKYSIQEWQNYAVRNIGQDKKNFLFIISSDSTELDDISSWNYFASIEKQIQLCLDISYLLNSVSQCSNINDLYIKNKVKLIVKSILNAKKVLIISGISSREKKLVYSIFNIIQSFKVRKPEDKLGVIFVLNYVNTMGVLLMGARGNLNDFFSVVKNNQRNKVNITVILLENDLYRFYPNKYIDLIFKNILHVIVLDFIYTKIQKKSDLTLSSTSFVESSGTVVNYEGRAQRFFKLFDPVFYNKKNIILESWIWLFYLNFLFKDKKIKNITIFDVIKKIEKDIFSLRGIKKLYFYSNKFKISRKFNRYSGSTAMYSNIDVHEPTPMKDKDAIFTFSSGINNIYLKNKKNILYEWFSNWNSCQSWNKIYYNEKQKSFLYFGKKILKKKNRNIRFFHINYSNLFVKNYWRIVPYSNFFGNDETSQYSLEIRKEMYNPYIVFSTFDANIFNITCKSIVYLVYSGLNILLKVQISKKLSNNSIGLSIGLPNLPLNLSNYVVSIIKNNYLVFSVVVLK